MDEVVRGVVEVGLLEDEEEDGLLVVEEWAMEEELGLLVVDADADAGVLWLLDALEM